MRIIPFHVPSCHHVYNAQRVLFFCSTIRRLNSLQPHAKRLLIAYCYMKLTSAPSITFLSPEDRHTFSCHCFSLLYCYTWFPQSCCKRLITYTPLINITPARVTFVVTCTTLLNNLLLHILLSRLCILQFYCILNHVLGYSSMYVHYSSEFMAHAWHLFISSSPINNSTHPNTLCCIKIFL